MYKLLGLDMDGTLLREDKTISEVTKQKIAEAKAKGVKVVLASGRPLEGLQRYLKELDLVHEGDYVVSFNGAVVQDTYTKEIVSKTTLKGTDLHKIYALSKELGVNIHAFTSEGCITPVLTKYSILEGEINGIDVAVIDYDAVSTEEDLIKIMLVDEPEALEAAMKNIPQHFYDTYTVVRSAPFFLEFLNKKVDKGTGMKALADALAIKQEEVICIGDAGNDEHMVRYAGLGVAMGNAFPELKEIADFITKTNEEDGVAHVIDTYIL